MSAILLALLLAALALDLALRVRLIRLAVQVHRLAASAGMAPSAQGNALASIQQGLIDLRAAANRLRSRLAEEESRRRRVEENLHESEERYALAVRSAGDGMWEWNLKTGAVIYSPRWKSMLGQAEQEVGSEIEEWRSRIHPDDRGRVLAELNAHLQGRSLRFESEHRLRHRDGEYRWVLVRAQAVQHANGMPYRMVGLNADITPRRRVQEVLLEIADGLAGLSGEHCYHALVEKLAALAGVQEVFLTECCNYPITRVRMLAYWTGGHFAECEEFDLAGTPCEDVIRGGRPLFVPCNVVARWPREKQYGTEGYLGLPCIDTKGSVIGHIACKSRSEIRAGLPHQAVLKLFAVRAAVEIERQWLKRRRCDISGGP